MTVQHSLVRSDCLAVSTIFLVNGLLYTSWLSRLPDLQQLYGMNHSRTGLVLFSLGLGALFAMPFAGLLIQRFGSHQVTSKSALLFCLLASLTPVMGTSTRLGCLLFVLGMSAGTMDVAMNAQAVLSEQKVQRPLMSSFHAVFSGGMMLGAIAGAVFTSFSIPVAPHLWIVVAASVAGALWANRNLMPDEFTKHGSGENDGRFQWPPQALLSIGVIAFCSMLGEGTMADWSTNYMKEIAQASGTTAPLGLGAFSAAMMLGRILGDRARNSIGDETLLVATSLVALIGMIVLVAIPVPVAVVGAMATVGMGLSVVSPIAYSTAGNVEGLPAGVGISIVTTIGYSGFLLGPPIIGFLADWKTLRTSMLFVGMLFVLMSLLASARFRRSRRATH